MQITTKQTLGIIGSIAKIDFRELDSNDRAAFAGAAEDALIGFTGGKLSDVMGEVISDPIMDEGDDSVAIIISDGAIELHAATLDLEPVCISLSLSRLI